MHMLTTFQELISNPQHIERRYENKGSIRKIMVNVCACDYAIWGLLHSEQTIYSIAVRSTYARHILYRDML